MELCPESLGLKMWLRTKSEFILFELRCQCYRVSFNFAEPHREPQHEVQCNIDDAEPRRSKDAAKLPPPNVSHDVM